MFYQSSFLAAIVAINVCLCLYTVIGTYNKNSVITIDMGTINSSRTTVVMVIVVEVSRIHLHSLGVKSWIGHCTCE